MSDLKLFRLSGNSVSAVDSGPAAVEKSLQALLERHLDTFLGVRFLATEYQTGKTHGGRIDTLGIDENKAPVIIEYKRSLNENVINQGLFYLDWLLDHKAEFELLVQRKLGAEEAKGIEWSAPRLVCIAGDFTKYDEHAVRQINRNIELMRYARYGTDLLLLDLVNATVAGPEPSKSSASSSGKVPYKTVSEYLDQSPQALKDVFEEVRSFLLALGDDVQEKELQYYFAFKRIKNFACVEVHPMNEVVVAYAKVDPSSIKLEPGFTRDVTNIGHFGTGDLEITLRSSADLVRAKELLVRSYESS